jgi:hypothetical protein
LTGNIGACAGQSITLEASYPGAASFEWLEGGVMVAGASDSILTVMDDGDYAVVVSNGFCADTSNVLEVSFFALPPADAGSDEVICEGDSVQLTAMGGMDYYWNTGATAAAIVVLPQQHTTYWVEVTDSNGCTAMDSVEVMVTSNPAIPSLAVSGNTVSTPSAYTGYQWYLEGSAIPGAVGGSYEITVSGNYQLQVTDSNGCSAVSSSIYLEWVGTVLLQSGKLLIYPNPAEDALFLEFQDSPRNETVMLYNVLGELILSVEIGPENPFVIDIKGFAEGVYFLKVGEEGLFKIVKL